MDSVGNSILVLEEPLQRAFRKYGDAVNLDGELS